MFWADLELSCVTRNERFEWMIWDDWERFGPIWNVLKQYGMIRSRLGLFEFDCDLERFGSIWNGLA